MIFILNFVRDVNEFFEKHGDSRLTNCPTMSSPFYPIGMSLTFLYVVKILGPKLLENRKPFQLKKALLIYNSFQVLISALLVYEFGMSGWFTGEYSYRCQPVDYSNTPNALRMLRAAKIYHFSKYTEFLDTVFFVMRKKYHQVTTLHLIHHSIMPVTSWFGLRFFPGGHSTFLCMLNSFVHIIMYGYYFLSALGPKIQKYLWWKKYLTTLQLIQFVVVLIHTIQLFFIECDYPRSFVWVIVTHSVLFFFLFKNFYSQAYKERHSKKIN